MGAVGQRLIALLAGGLLAGCAGGAGVPDSGLDGGVDAAGDADGDAALDSGPDGDGDVDDDADLDEACPEGWQERFDDGGEIELEEPFEGELTECAVVARFAVLVAGSSYRLELEDMPPGALVRARQGAEGAEIGQVEAGADGAAAIEITPAVSGEVRLELTGAADGRVSGGYGGLLTCLDGCDLEATRYPLVLVHGMGNEAYFTFLEYFNGVVDDLSERGYEVRAPVVSYIGHSAQRAEQLAEQIDELLAETGAAKVHLITHSQGGLDARVLISGLGYADRVASVTTVAAPHRGLRTSVPAWFTPMDVSEEYMTGEFAEAYPDDPSVPAFSWAGATCLATDLACQGDLDGEIVATQLSTTYWSVLVAHGDDEFSGANDGLVPVASARWGEFLGILPADHFDQIGHIPGQRWGPFEHLEFFLEEARRLRQLELS